MNPIKSSSRSLMGKRQLTSSWHVLMAAILGAILVVLLVASSGSSLVEASPAAAINEGQQQVAGINNLENLISDFLEDAGSRLKKSKVNSMRQIKQTLRFGRRSDPLMSPAALLEQLALENELENQQQQNY